MKKSSFLFILFIFIYTSMFCCLNFVCFGANYKVIGNSLDSALKLKEAGDIDGAIMSIRRALAGGFLAKELMPGVDERDIYTKEYLQTLIECLKADEITYIAIIKHITLAVKRTKELFFKIADELKAGKISPENAAFIKEMKFEISREIVTHSFCVPPKGYKEVYNSTQGALFWYSKAWGSLDRLAHEKVNEKAKLEAGALLSFQKGNELFSRAGILMLAIPTR